MSSLGMFRSLLHSCLFLENVVVSHLEEISTFISGEKKEKGRQSCWPIKEDSGGVGNFSVQFWVGN